MNKITIKPDNVTHIARYLLTLNASLFPQDYQRQWLKDQQCLREVLDQFLEPRYLFPRETVIEYFDRSLYALVTCTRNITELLPKKAQREIPMTI